MLVRYCVRYTKDHYKAEDTAQEALCLAWENLEQLEDPQRADRWLFSIAANLLRRRDPYSGGELPPEDDLPSCESAEEQLLKEEWIREVAALVQELPMLQRQAVYFCLVLERSPAQLAAVLNVSPHAVSARLYRGLQTLRKKWKALR